MMAATIFTTTAIPFYDEYLRVKDILDALYIEESVFRDVVLKLVFTMSPLVMAITLSGSVTNLINILVFYRQGILSDSCTVTLATISVVDFYHSSSEFMAGVTMLIVLRAGDMRDDPEVPTIYYEEYDAYVSTTSAAVMKVVLLCLYFPSFALTELSGWATAYLAFERMISVAFPFTVKAIFTAKRTCIILSIFLFAAFFIYIPRFLRAKLVWIEIEAGNNNTDPVYHLEFVESGWVPETLSTEIIFVNRNVFHNATIIIIVSCNVVIAIKVNISKRFRKSTTTVTTSTSTTTQTTPSNTTSNQQNVRSGSTHTRTRKETVADEAESVSASRIMINKVPKTTTTRSNDTNTAREDRLLRMMVLLSITFVISRIPGLAYQIITKVMIEISDYWGKRAMEYNVYFMMTMESVGSCLLHLNEATNIFIYLSMSKNYRKSVQRLFSCSNNSTTRSL